MDYHCLDCSYQGKKFISGACPACGSNNIRRAQQDISTPVAKPKPYRLIAAVALWLLFLVELYKKISS
ncbi:hypothetical protein [Dasania marina]|uniref:hypothetical protein n=1 Tax=Dasania marina TaxID=471499 RepID=UPI0030D7F592|tara:strand:- start:106115 stop:106318 length:204 start_codon:yes stop_codon:yes gene_type:complete